ncbi:hypothetical protein QCA50_020958 [Cerrena zonata]|uniref:WW domain-containing protein n=1 Tax=Cerrena zonata TaxID=2478898 RepID=A0AAW0F9K0_9APHY
MAAAPSAALPDAHLPSSTAASRRNPLPRSTLPSSQTLQKSSSLAPQISISSSANTSLGSQVGDGWGAHFWVTLVDPQSGVSFYACPSTGEVSWDPPVGNFLLPPSPDGEWWEMFDEASGPALLLSYKDLQRLFGNGLRLLSFL